MPVRPRQRSVYLPDDLWEALGAIVATREYPSRNEIIITVVEEWLEARRNRCRLCQAPMDGTWLPAHRRTRCCPACARELNALLEG